MHMLEVSPQAIGLHLTSTLLSALDIKLHYDRIRDIRTKPCVQGLPGWSISQKHFYEEAEIKKNEANVSE